jgi:hypothetical protein
MEIGNEYLVQFSLAVLFEAFEVLPGTPCHLNASGRRKSLVAPKRRCHHIPSRCNPTRGSLIKNELTLMDRESGARICRVLLSVVLQRPV